MMEVSQLVTWGLEYYLKHGGIFMVFRIGIVFMSISILGLLYMFHVAFIKKAKIYSVIYSIISIVGLQFGMFALFSILIYFVDSQNESLVTSSRILIQLYASLLAPIYLLPSIFIHNREEKKKKMEEISKL